MDKNVTQAFDNLAKVESNKGSRLVTADLLRKEAFNLNPSEMKELANEINNSSNFNGLKIENDNGQFNFVNSAKSLEVYKLSSILADGIIGTGSAGALGLALMATRLASPQAALIGSLAVGAALGFMEYIVPLQKSDKYEFKHADLSDQVN